MRVVIFEKLFAFFPNERERFRKELEIADSHAVRVREHVGRPPLIVDELIVDHFALRRQIASQMLGDPNLNAPGILLLFERFFERRTVAVECGAVAPPAARHAENVRHAVERFEVALLRGFRSERRFVENARVREHILARKLIARGEPLVNREAFERFGGLFRRLSGQTRKRNRLRIRIDLFDFAIVSWHGFRLGSFQGRDDGVRICGGGRVRAERRSAGAERQRERREQRDGQAQKLG